MEDMKMFFEGGYNTLPLNGEVRPNWALETVTVNFSLLNPLITKENVEIFYNSFVQQIKDQKIIGKKNIVIFQCDSRSPGTIQSSDEELQKSFMLFHNYVKYRGQSLGYFFFFDAKEFPAVGVFWTKALCLYLLHVLLPHFCIIYLDSDAVMFDQFFINLRKDVTPPCIVSASEYAGMHNAGFYCIYPDELTNIVEEIRFLDLADFCDEVFKDEDQVSACRNTSAEVTSLFRGMAGQYSLQQHQQKLLSLVWRGTGVDELHINTIREALIVWVHVLGRWGNSHFSDKDINSKQCHRLTNLSEEEMTLEWAGISFEQGLSQYIIRLAEVSGVSRLVPLFSGNAGWMVAENLHRFELQGTVEMVDSLLRDPIKNEWDFSNKVKAMPAPKIVTHGLQPPAVVDLFGHLKNHHLMLRRMIFARMR